MKKLRTLSFFFCLSLIVPGALNAAEQIEQTGHPASELPSYVVVQTSVDASGNETEPRYYFVYDYAEPVEGPAGAAKLQAHIEKQGIQAQTLESLSQQASIPATIDQMFVLFDSMGMETGENVRNWRAYGRTGRGHGFYGYGRRGRYGYGHGYSPYRYGRYGFHIGARLYPFGRVGVRFGRGGNRFYYYNNPYRRW